MTFRILILGLAAMLLFGCAAQEAAPGEELEGGMSAAPEPEEPEEPAKDIVVLETSKGNIEIELDSESSPTTVANFLGYVQSGFYEGTIFHRVIPGFMVQGGGFTAEARQKETNAPIRLESNNGLKNTAGTVAMARTTAPHSATSQFFINTVDNAFLDYSPGNDGYAVFGKVVSGMDVVHEIEGVQTGAGDWPLETIVIRNAYLKG